MKMKTALSLALALGIGAIAPCAHADPPKDDKGYAYDFPDDKMLGADGNGTVPVIRVRPPSGKSALHRPRLQFVQEMLKSVENM